MLVQIARVLDPQQVQRFRERLLARDAPWVDGRVTAGRQGARVKHNQQIDESSSLARELGDEILAGLERHPLFVSAVLPLRVYPPMFNRYEPGMRFGSHVDGAIRLVPVHEAKIRTDVSMTLFLTEPSDYEGGELEIEDTYGVHSVKLPAGDLIVYPASSLHQVTPVTRGARISSFLWAQSMVRDAAQRALMFDLDNAIQHLNVTGGQEAVRIRLTSCYHNLLRMWSET